MRCNFFEGSVQFVQGPITNDWLIGCSFLRFRREERNLFSNLKFELESRAAPSVDGSQLFRNSIAAATISCYEKLVGREYLSETLGPLIQKTILWSTEGILEVDPEKIKPTNTLKKNQERFIMLVQEFLDAIFDSIDKFPPPCEEGAEYIPHPFIINLPLSYPLFCCHSSHCHSLHCYIWWYAFLFLDYRSWNKIEKQCLHRTNSLV